MSDVILNYGYKVTNNIWNNNKLSSTFFKFRNGKKLPNRVCNGLMDREMGDESKIK